MKSLALHPSSRLVDRLEIAAPCHARWEDMVGDERTRFCGQCTKNVYNVASMKADEVKQLITANEGRACLRLYRRKDGTVITSDCPVGLAERAYKRARRMVLASVALIVTMTGGIFASLVRPSCDDPGADSSMTNDVAVRVEPEPDYDDRIVMGDVAFIPEEPAAKMGEPAPLMGRIKVR